MYPTETYSEEDAERLMGICLTEARRSYEAGEVPVGCAFVDRRDKSVVYVASNKTNEDKNACRHAELIAYKAILKKLGSAKKWDDLAPYIDVWVSCEPCIMCAAALKTIGVNRCIFGCANARFGGCGTAVDVATIQGKEGYVHPLECYSGYKETEAIAILQIFYERGNIHAPDQKRKRPLKNE